MVAPIWIGLASVLLCNAAPVVDAKKLAGMVVEKQPFWSATTMINEPVLFIQKEGCSVATGTLLFTPNAKPRVTHPDCIMTYIEGKDYIWKPGTAELELTISSRIPYKTAAQMAPPDGSPNTLGGVLFSNGHFFHDLQVQVSYEHSETWPEPDVHQKRRLARSLGKLLAKQPFKIVVLGDSITEGYNASGFSKVWAPPYQPNFASLVANTLGEHFNAPVALTNLGLGGKKADWGLSMVEKVAIEKPDLVILAFGMNHAEPAPAFGVSMQKLLDSVQAGSPEADVILVAPMTSNPRFPNSVRFCDYRDVLRGMEKPNIALADVTTPWLKLLERKSFSDLSGNNVNHPNDFGHRLYAQVICQLFWQPYDEK